jgi:hypothetical protein
MAVSAGTDSLAQELGLELAVAEGDLRIQEPAVRAGPAASTAAVAAVAAAELSSVARAGWVAWAVLSLPRTSKPFADDALRRSPRA